MTKKEFFEKYKMKDYWFYCDICDVEFKNSFALVIKQFEYDEYSGEWDEIDISICKNCFVGKEDENE